MEKLILGFNRYIVITVGDKKEGYNFRVVKEFPNTMFDEITSREGLFKLLTILEVPENLEFLNLDETFAFAYENRICEEDFLEDRFLKDSEHNEKELDELFKEKHPDLYNFFQRTTPEKALDVEEVVWGDEWLEETKNKKSPLDRYLAEGISRIYTLR